MIHNSVPSSNQAKTSGKSGGELGHFLSCHMPSSPTHPACGDSCCYEAQCCFMQLFIPKVINSVYQINPIITSRNRKLTLPTAFYNTEPQNNHILAYSIMQTQQKRFNYSYFVKSQNDIVIKVLGWFRSTTAVKGHCDSVPVTFSLGSHIVL